MRPAPPPRLRPLSAGLAPAALFNPAGAERAAVVVLLILSAAACFHLAALIQIG